MASPAGTIEVARVESADPPEPPPTPTNPATPSAPPIICATGIAKRAPNTPRLPPPFAAWTPAPPLTWNRPLPGAHAAAPAKVDPLEPPDPDPPLMSRATTIPGAAQAFWRTGAPGSCA